MIGRLRTRLLWIGCLPLVMSVGGCATIGPRTVPRDRFDYTQAVSQSWFEQILANIVRIRYADAPTFLDVGQIVSSYELRREGSVAADLYVDPASPDTFAGARAGAGFIDRPTITYQPLTGEKLAKMLLAPVPHYSLIYLVRAGYDAEAILLLYLRSFNGQRNPIVADAAASEHALFLRTVALLRQLQAGNAFDVRWSQTGTVDAFVFATHADRPDLAAELDELRTLLRLGSEQAEVKVRSGLLPGAPGDISLFTNSVLQVMFVLSQSVDVPQKDIDVGLASAAQMVGGSASRPTVSVKTSDSPPTAAFVSVRYAGHWFYIDARDLRSKSTFSSLSVIMRLLESGPPGQVPLLTIPTGS